MNGFSQDEPTHGKTRVMEEGREAYERNTKGADWFAHSNGHVDAKPNARLGTDAARDNAMKNRGSMAESMSGNPVSNGVDGSIHPRALKGEAAQANAMKNRGSMAESMSGYPVSNGVERTVHPRAVKGEAAAIAQENKGGNLRNLMENYGNLQISPRPAGKVQGEEAEMNKEREKGSKYILNHYAPDPIPASEMAPAPRLGHGGAEVADKHRGENMGPLMRLEGKKTPREPKAAGRLHQTSSGGGWDEVPPQSRTRPEGAGIAQKNSADSMNEILLQNNGTPPQRTTPKILKHMAESETPKNAPKQRVRLDGFKNMEKANNREEMSAIMHGSPSSNSPSRPDSAKRILPHLKRSELW